MFEYNVVIFKMENIESVMYYYNNYFKWLLFPEFI